MVIRPATIGDAARIAWVSQVTWKAAYRGILPDEVLDQSNFAEETAYWQDQIAHIANNRFLFCAEMDGQVIGFCAGGPDRDQDEKYEGELYALYVLPEMQRCGVGWALTQAGMDWLKERGLGRMLVWVLRDNLPACRFYEVSGGTAVRERVIEIAGVPLEEIGYGYEL